MSDPSQEEPQFTDSEGEKNNETLIAELQGKCAQLEDQAKRSIADYQNLLRRTQQEREQFRLYAYEPAMTALLAPLDHFYYALKSFNEKSDAGQVLSSMKMIWTSFMQSLEPIGFTCINPDLDSSFDPVFQEALSQIPSADKAEGSILEVFRPGYSLNGKVLKPAQVSVAIAPNNPE